MLVCLRVEVAMNVSRKIGYRKMLRRKRELHQLLRIHDSKCSACGEPVALKDEASPRYATIDHTVPLSAGGSDLMTNKTLMCRECNQAKGCQVPEGAQLNRGPDL